MDIFVIQIANIEHIPSKLLSQFQHKNFSNITKQNEHSLSYLMLDRILKEIYKLENREIEFRNGKPYLKNHKKHFSISHSNSLIALAFSDYPCGIDIEGIKDRDYAKIAKRMGLECSNLEEFYTAWTKYEAEYKLNDKSNSHWQAQISNYVITAVSTNPAETFELFYQSEAQ